MTLSKTAMAEIINGCWLSVTDMMQASNRLKKHVTTQANYEAVIAEKITPRLSGVIEIMTWVDASKVVLSETMVNQRAAVDQAIRQLQADETRQLDLVELTKRQQDREEGRYSRHRRGHQR